MTAGQPSTEPIRMCVVCRARAPKHDLTRWVRDLQGDWKADPRRTAPGRGAWMCASCMTTADIKRLRRPFRQQAEQIHSQLQQQGGGMAAAQEG